MEVLLKGASGIARVPIDAANLDERKIYLEGVIDSGLANSFVRQMMHLASQDPHGQVDVLINSTGGSVSAGLAIADTILSSSLPIRTICIEQAYSMAAILLSCGTAGRLIFPHSRVMLHRPWIDARIQANQSDILHIAQSMEDQEKEVLQVLEKTTGKTQEELKKAMSYDHFFSSQESVEFGLCDQIIGFQEIMEG